MRIRHPRIADLAIWVAVASAGMVVLREARHHGDPSVLILPVLSSATLLLLGRAAIAARFGPEAGRGTSAGVCLFSFAYLLGLAGGLHASPFESVKPLPGQLVDAAIAANTTPPANWLGRTANSLGIGYQDGPMTLLL